MTTYYVDNSFAAGGASNTGLSKGVPISTLDALNKIKLQPGDTVAFMAGTTYNASSSGSGALVITASGTEAAPITFTTYGTGAAPIINNAASGYSDGILLSGAKYVVIEGLHIGAAAQAGINIKSNSSNITVQNVEVSGSGEGVLVNGSNNYIGHNYFHDLKMVKNTANVSDDDYGAVGVVVANSNNEIAYNKIVNAKASSYDYGTDGGGIELFGTMTNVSIHDNWVENSDGFIEAGGNKSSLSNIAIYNNVSVNNGTFLLLHNGGGAFASSFENVVARNNSIVNQNNATREMATVFLDNAYKAGQLTFKDNVVYLNSGDSFFKQIGDYHTDNTFYKMSSDTHLYNNWSMALNSGETFSTLVAKPGQTLIETIASQSGKGASFTSSTHSGVVVSTAGSDTASSPAPTPSAVALPTSGNGAATSPASTPGAIAASTPSHDVASALGLNVERSAFGTIATDTTSHGGQVYALYHGLLGRDPDVLGLEHWTATLDDGRSVNDLASSLLGSVEGQGRSGASDSAGFVSQLYKTTLHRDADTAGLTYWTDQLDHGVTRSSVGVAFSLSSEHVATLQPALASGIFVADADAAAAARVYYTVLGRAPDEGGLTFWKDSLKAGASTTVMTASMLNAPEVVQKTGGLTTSQYVDLVYENALGRHADAGGLKFWTDAIDGHSASRADVTTQIGQSVEAQAHLAPLIEQGWFLHG